MCVCAEATKCPAVSARDDTNTRPPTAVITTRNWTNCSAWQQGFTGTRGADSFLECKEWKQHKWLVQGRPGCDLWPHKHKHTALYCWHCFGATVKTCVVCCKQWLLSTSLTISTYLSLGTSKFKCVAKTAVKPLTNLHPYMSWPITTVYLLACEDVRGSHVGIIHCYWTRSHIPEPFTDDFISVSEPSVCFC